MVNLAADGVARLTGGAVGIAGAMGGGATEFCRPERETSAVAGRSAGDDDQEVDRSPLDASPAECVVSKAMRRAPSKGGLGLLAGL